MGKKGNRNTDAIDDINGEFLVEPEEITYKWQEYVSELLNVQSDTRNMEICSNDDKRQENEKTENKMRAALTRMKRGKAVGEDRLPIKIIAAAGEEAICHVRTIFQVVFGTKQVLLDLQKVKICSIFKKGERTVCCDYRGISDLILSMKMLMDKNWE